MTTLAKILCVDDDPYLLDLLRYALAREGFEVVTAGTGREALRRLRGEGLDLAILDVNLPDTNGFKVLASLRASSTLPVVMLTARAQDEDIVAGFGEGADDYVGKPFNVQVLVTRVRAVLRRAQAQTATAGAGVPNAPVGEGYQVGGAVFAPETNEVVGDGVRVRLTQTEGRILGLLFAHEGQVLAAGVIMERLWGYESESDVNVIKTHIRHLRAKIDRLPGAPQPIRTLPGVGYMAVQTDKDGKILSPAAATS